MRIRLKSILILLAIFIVASSILFAQTRSGTLKIIVVDDQGNVIPGVTLTLTSPVMMGDRNLITDVLGEALFVNLTPGIYQLKSNLEGFQDRIEFEEYRLTIKEKRLIMRFAHLESTLALLQNQMVAMGLSS